MNSTETKVISLSSFINRQNQALPLVETFHEFEQDNRVLAKRSLAFFVDIMAITFIKMILDSSYAIFIDTFLFFLPSQVQAQLLFSPPWAQILLTTTLFWGYFSLALFSLHGKTLGKVLFGITTVSDDFLYRFETQNYLISFKQCLKRTLGYMVCYLSLGTFFSFSFFSEDKRGLPDYFGKSRSISDEHLIYVLAQKKALAQVYSINIEALSKQEAA